MTIKQIETISRKDWFRRLGKLRGSEFQSFRESEKSDRIKDMIRDVADLEIYRESLKLLKELYAFLRKVPKSEIDTARHCKKTGKSIPANIAEGFAKRSSEKEFKRFLKIAIGLK